MNVEKAARIGSKAMNVIFVVLLLVSLIPVTLLLVLSHSSKKNCTEKVSATVVSMETWEDSDGVKDSSAVSPVFSFTYNGKEYEANLGSYTNHPKYSIGDTAEILIDPSDPTKIKDKNDKNTLSVALGFLILPLIVVVRYIQIKRRIRLAGSAVNEMLQQR